LSLCMMMELRPNSIITYVCIMIMEFRLAVCIELH